MMNDADQLEALRRAQKDSETAAKDRERSNLTPMERRALDYYTLKTKHENLRSGDKDNPVVDEGDEEPDRETAERFRGMALEGLEERVAELEAHSALRRTEVQHEVKALQERVAALESRMDNVPLMIGALRVEVLDGFKNRQKPRSAQAEEIETLRSKLQVAEAIIESKDVRLKEKDYQIEDLEKQVAAKEETLRDVREMFDRLAVKMTKMTTHRDFWRRAAIKDWKKLRENGIRNEV